jgi:hypothetical protein
MKQGLARLKLLEELPFYYISSFGRKMMLLYKALGNKTVLFEYYIYHSSTTITRWQILWQNENYKRQFLDFSSHLYHFNFDSGILVKKYLWAK